MRGATNPLKISAKAGGVLHLANRYDTGLTVNKTDEFVEIDSAISLFRHSDFNTQGITNPQPGVDVCRKLMAEGYEIIA